MGNLYNIKQVQKRYAVCERTVFGWIKAGILKGMKIAGKWQFTEEDLLNFENNFKQ